MSSVRFHVIINCEKGREMVTLDFLNGSFYATAKLFYPNPQTHK
jgi:hypothetical protein